ncbi:MAG: PH domain-containing protein [Phycisphaerae bacterium]|nr:PH domain-containing protein [Phycisphaerae bacterium]
MCTATLESPTYSGVGPGAATEAPAEEPVVSAEKILLPVDLLDGGEVVILALKPSLWFVLFDSAKWMVAGVVLIVGAALAGGRMEGVSYLTLAQGTMLVVACRVAVALLRWVSRFYVLTDRRVLRIHGVLRANILDIALTDIINTRVTALWHERLAGLGTLRFACQSAEQNNTSWCHLAKPDEVHSQVRRAIERAIDRRHHG